MSDHAKLATIECPVCSAWIDLYPAGDAGDPYAGLSRAIRDLCKVPPLPTCPNIRAEIEKRFPGHPATREPK